ncbi:hypothetical protein EVAR_83013_1 [Eumeta japonica]|uniref:Uncharacterized protein n=1 Tax=Eumeta variegata TaxID=151549 RepID=A0A4C2AAA9_EUMVA|nr:hypothetical protein EVAR_83013_1 [Eumeta japonica]
MYGVTRAQKPQVCHEAANLQRHRVSSFRARVGGGHSEMTMDDCRGGRKSAKIDDVIYGRSLCLKANRRKALKNFEEANNRAASTDLSVVKTALRLSEFLLSSVAPGLIVGVPVRLPTQMPAAEITPLENVRKLPAKTVPSFAVA